MLKPSKKSQTKLINKSTKNTFLRSHSADLIQSKSKGKSKKSLTKSPSTIIINNSSTTNKFFNTSQTKLTHTKQKQKSKVKKKYNSQKKKQCFKDQKDNKKKLKKDNSHGHIINKGYIIQPQFDNAKQNINNSSSCNNQQSWLQKLKKPINDFFVYHDNYIPIQNTEQRKIIQRIRLIDMEHKGIQIKSKDYEEQIEIDIKQSNVKSAEDQQIMTQIPILSLKESQTQVIQSNNIQVQTSLSNRDKKFNSNNEVQKQKFQQKVTKCFSNTLVDLQFLFLPDAKNFQNFSERQRQHYKQLFATLSKKFQIIKSSINQPNKNLNQKQQLNDQNVVLQLYQRQCTQMGWTQVNLKEGFPTHIFSILSYISNLFCFAELKQKSSIIAKMNSIYGYPYIERYIRASRNKSTKKFIPVLSDNLYVALQQQLFSNHQFPSQTIEVAVHTHNRMIFDCVNDFLQQFRPFYNIGGQPFPWNNSIGMTFYSIDQDSLGLLFNQIKDKIIQTATYLCGMHLDYNKYGQIVTQNLSLISQPSIGNKHPFHTQRIKHQQLKMINNEIKKYDQTSSIEQQYLKVGNQLSQLVTDQILIELFEDLQKTLLIQCGKNYQYLETTEITENIEYSSDFDGQSIN